MMPQPIDRPDDEGSEPTITPTGRPQNPAVEVESLFGRGTNLGRYVLLDPLGRGGMAEIYGAYDPELSRRVAIKLVRARSGGSSGTAGDQARLVREAQAMAQLAHPNVVAVYDVGTFRDRVFIAMELVEGGTLRDWLLDAKPGWREIVARFIEAGRGLEGAHAAGLIHRDFKPANVLVGSDGRVRVTDFGLARTAGGPETIADRASTHATPDPDASHPSLHTPLTVAGSVMGTPPYMSPEQHRGVPVDERTDQYSFFASLFEALYGVAPFGSSTVAEIAARVFAGKIEPTPRGTGVPARVREVVLKGLALEPDRRFLSMLAALLALDRAARPRRGRWLWVGAGAAALLGVGSYRAWAHYHGQSPCPGMEESRLASVWDEPAHRALEAAFLATTKPYARGSWTGTQRTLDTYATAWRLDAVDACESERAQPGAQWGQERLRCLDDRLDAFKGLVGQLAHPDAKLVLLGPVIAGSLPALRECADPRALRERSALTGSDNRPEVVEIRNKLAEAKVLIVAHRARTAVASLEPLAKAARATGNNALIADVLGELGSLQATAGQAPASLVVLEEADLAAESAGLDWIGARLALAQAHAYYQLDKAEEGKRWVRRARARTTRLGGDELLESDALVNDGALALVEGKVDEAEADEEKALDIRRRLLGPEAPLTVTALENVALILESTGRWDDAVARSREADALREKLYGPDNPVMASARFLLAHLLANQGDFQEALAMVRAAVPVAEREYGPDDPRMAQAHATLGEALEGLGHGQEAAQEFARLHAILQRAFGPESVQVAGAMTEEADLQRAQGEVRDALALTRRALALFDKAGARSDERSQVLGLLGRIELELGQPDAALRDLQSAIAAQASIGGPQNMERSYMQSDLGEAHLALGQPQQALKLLEPALALMREHKTPVLVRARTAFALARALEKSGGDLTRARALARDSLLGTGAGLEDAHVLGAAVRKWLDSHPGP